MAWHVEAHKCVIVLPSKVKYTIKNIHAVLMKLLKKYMYKKAPKMVAMEMQMTNAKSCPIHLHTVPIWKVLDPIF